ncbi:MAG: M28 family metallopeptidase, partial [Candidatus Eiseniibacteriota bacterium]
LEGRGTGTRGYDIAAAYVATQFEAAGLEPGGVNGTWFQPVPFRRLQGDPGAGGIVLLRRAREQRLTRDTDYLMGNDPVHERADISAPLAFAGYGVTAPELGYDDYAHVDVRNKIAVLLSGGPPTFGSEPRAYHSSGYVKTRTAVARGAVGIVTVRTPVDEARGPWARSVNQSRLPGMRWLDPAGVPNESYPQLEVTATLSRSGSEALFADSPVPLARVFAAADSGRPQGFDLPVRMRAWSRTRHSRVESPNVLGLLRGADPKLRDEVVVISAHLDHLGIGVPVNGDSIHNGAYDNATGCGSLIELARAFAALPERPRRSILFVALTGEEKGLQGSDYLTHFPTVPLERIVADINMDMFLMLEPMREVIVFGGGHSTLGPIAVRAARAVGLAPIPDPTPEEVVFVRSDQFPFVRQGVPAVYPVLSGARRVAPGDSLSPMQRWRRTIYHSPQDDMSQTMDMESGARFMRMQFLLGLEVANTTARPAWNRGDFFGETFARGRR